MELGAPVEDADVVETEESPGEHVAPGGVLAVDPPAEVQHQPLKRPFQEPGVGATEGALHIVEEEGGPGVHRGIHIAEVPLVGGNLPIGVGIETAQHQQQLLLGEIEVDQRQGDRVEGQVPGRIPRVFPLVRHRNDVGVQHVKPVGIAHAAAAGWHERMTVVLLKPSIQIEVVGPACSTACPPAPDGAPGAHLR